MQDFKIFSLGDVCNFATDKIFVSLLDEKNYISTENLLQNKAGFAPASSLPKILKTSAFQIGDVLVSNIRPYFKKILYANFSGGCSNDVLVFRANSFIDSKFLFYVLSEDRFFNYATATAKGTKMPRGDKNSIMKFEVKIPPLEVQKKIAAVLSSLDDKIELNNKINQNLEQQAQAIFDEFFKNDCNIGKIGDYCEVKSGFAFKRQWWQEKGIPVIKIGSINQDEINFSKCSFVSEDKINLSKNFIVKCGDLVIAMTGATVGKFAFIPETRDIILVNQRVGKFFLGDEPIEKLPFMYCTLKSNGVYLELINKAQGSAQANISPQDIMSVACKFPSMKKINEFNKFSLPFFRKITINQQENKSLAEMRDLLLPRLLNGEIDVSKVEV